MTFPNPEYNVMDFNSAYPYSLGPNPFDASKEYEGADIAAPFTNNYPEGPQDGMASFGQIVGRHDELIRLMIQNTNPFNHLLKMEDALPEELR